MSEAIQINEDPALIMARRFGITTTTQGAAFGWPFKLFACAIVLNIAYWFVQAVPNMVAISQLPTQVQFMFLALLVLIGVTLYFVMVSRTTVSPTEIHQNFVFNRHIHLGEVSFAKFIYIPYLTWLIAPRLFVRTASNKFAAIYGATPELHRVFGQIHRTIAQGSK
jgi:hypothetical protein